MKLIATIFIAGGIAACGSSKQTASTGNAADALVSSSPASPPNAVPSCILKMIDSAKASKDGLSITEIRRYIYNGAKVYLVGAPCCDQYNPVYDSACNYLFAPSGGFTGKGDRSHPDFFTEAKEDSLIWKQK